ncbi:MAG: DUF6356 family protein [SAR86 cluster bacterium]|jgi:hypothetical protein|nr:DUF6356 family protein [SAR86 cluster bacterium]
MWVDFKHLSKANIGYIPHALRVSVVSLKLILIGVAGIIHAFLPVIFIETVSKGVKKLYDEISNF